MEAFVRVFENAQEQTGTGNKIPKQIVGAWGEMIGSSADAITPDVTTGKILSYIKLTRTATGDGDLMGDGAGGVAMSIAGDVVSVTDGTYTTYTQAITDFAAVDEQVILVVELTADAMRIGQYKETLPIVYGDEVTSTGTITITPITHGDTATPVGKPLRGLQSTEELSSKDVEKYLTAATLNAWRDESGNYIQVERT